MKERERKKAEVEAQKARVPPPPRRDEPAIKNEATDVPVDDRSMEEREEAVHAGDSQVLMMILRKDESKKRSELR